HWTHSRLICAAGLRCAAARPAAAARAEAWRALADELVAWADRARMPAGAWQRSPSDSRLDAALVFPALRGATAVQDPRATATVDAVRDELSDEFFAYRYRPDERPLGEAEGAFLLCGFGMALALNAAGRPIEAAHWFERNRSACGPPGLLAEEFDVVQRQLRGNLPQAFVHALLLECAATLPGVEIDRNDEKESI
ncbi:MAG TPA: glycoside hydrolase family 15 protein, partial [Solirubrobacteraceae bacterium]|nr:glycoside hydrolase family 15 protein [Solirubrobacteraceae bacterium]